MICTTSHAAYSLLRASAIAAPRSEQHLGVGTSGRPASQQCQPTVNLRHLGRGRRQSEVQKRRRSLCGKGLESFQAVSSDAAFRELPTRIQRWWRSLAAATQSVERDLQDRPLVLPGNTAPPSKGSVLVLLLIEVLHYPTRQVEQTIWHFTAEPYTCLELDEAMGWHRYRSDFD